MNQKELSRRLKDLYLTENGKKILDYLKDTYVDRIVFDKEPTVCAYELGKKEVIEDLLILLNREGK